ncbi:MAG: hypothetical protein P1U63_00850 [Coxiellaceae bacterium]|nr:hypothetical protein [Coxiellaceae bacterium]
MRTDHVAPPKPTFVLADLLADPKPSTAKAIGGCIDRFANSYKHHFPASQRVGGYSWTCPKGVRSLVASGYNLFKDKATRPAHTRKRGYDVELLQNQVAQVINRSDLTNEEQLVRIRRLLFLYVAYRIQQESSVRFAYMGEVFEFSQLLLSKAFDITLRLPEALSRGYLDYERAVSDDNNMPSGLGLFKRVYAGVLAAAGDLDVNSEEAEDIFRQLAGSDGKLALANIMSRVVASGGYHDEVAAQAGAMSSVSL